MRQAVAPGAELANLSAAVENPEAASLSRVIGLQLRYGKRAVRPHLQREVTEAPTVPGPGDFRWYNDMMAKIDNARGNLAQLRRLVAEGAAHTTGSSAPPTAVGLPSDAREVERMFKQGSERHARVVAAFTRRYAADKTVRKDRYGPFFAKLQRFTRLWVEYKTLLNR